MLSYVVSNRSTLTTYYWSPQEDGTEKIFHSSRGNENLVSEHAESIGRNVVSNMVLSYFSYKPYEGGIELTHILKYDPSGTIPEYMKQKQVGRTMRSLKTVVDYCRDGTIPEALF